MTKWGHMNVCTFYLKHSQSNIFFLIFTLLVVYGTLTKRVVSNWTDLEINSRVQVIEAYKPTAYIHIPVEVK